MERRRMVALIIATAVCATAFLHPGWISSSGYRRLPKTRNAVIHLRMQRTTVVGASSAKPCLQLAVSSCMIPHPDKAAKGGEDACFMLESDMGVFDGVGSWGSKGHDPGVFTRGFAEAVAANITAQRSEELVSHYYRNPEEETNLQRLAKGVDLERALEYAISHTQGKGTCTACLVSYDSRRELLSGLNLGDSGALLIRRDTRGTPFVALRSVTQRHGFNQSYQLGTESGDRPSDALPFGFFVREGDVVILASDGLLDNMSETNIVRCIAETSEREVGSASAYTDRMLPQGSNGLATDLAGALARRASELSRDQEMVSPLEEEAVAAGIISARNSAEGAMGEGDEKLRWPTSPLEAFMECGRLLSGLKLNSSRRRVVSEDEALRFRGGKIDDINVVVATVQRARSAVEDRNSELASKDSGDGLLG